MNQQPSNNELPTVASAAEQHRTALCKLFARCASLGVVGLGASVLAGWLFDIDWLKRFHPGWVTMKANSAFCFILAGLALWMLCPGPATRLKLRMAQVCALTIAFFGLLTLGEYLFGRDLGIDHLLFREHGAEPGSPTPGRMAPTTAFNFVLLGMALVFLDAKTGRRRWPAQYFNLAAAAITLFAFVGYFYGVEAGYWIVPIASIALHTIVAFLLLCLGILFARSDQGVMVVLTSDRGEGVVTRRALPAVLLLPVLLGWFERLGHQSGFYGPGFGSALLATSLVIILGWIIWRSAGVLNHIDRERIRAEEARLRLADAVEFSDDAIIGKTLNGIITSWNRGAERIFGYTAAEVVGLSISILIPPGNVNEEPEILGRLRQGERIEHYETVRRRKDGSLVDVSLTVSPIKDSVGKIIGASKIARDITGRKQDEEALRRSDALKSAILDSAMDAILSIDHEGKIHEWNRAAKAIFGYSKVEAAGRRVDELIIPPGQREYYHNRLAEYLMTGVGSLLGRPFELTLIRSDGTEFHGELAITRNSQDELSQYTCILRDINERKQAEADRVFLAAIVESSDDAIVSKSLKGIITSWNRGAERMFGFTAQEAVGQPMTLIVPAERHREEERILARLNRGERIEHFETIRHRKDGSLLNVSLTISPIRDSLGRIVGASKIARDITERKRTEEALRLSETSYRTLAEELEIKVRERTAQLQTSLNSVEDLLYTISHDLRAPNRTMQGFAQLLESEYGSQLDDTARDYLNRIGTAAVRNDELIRDLLEYGRLSHQAVPLTVLDPRETVEFVLVALGEEIQQRHAHIYLAGEWPLVVANDSLLKQIVTNLVANAIIYVPKDRTPDVAISVESKNGNAVLRVKDNGIGISPEQIDQAFKPFNRLPNPINAPGTGMGLAIVKKAAERMNAAVGAESTPGGGTCFWLELPKA